MIRAAVLAAAVLAVVPVAAGASERQRIVGGGLASDGEYPAQAVVSSAVGGCGGTLVATRKVVTAAHCLDEGLVLGPDPVEPGEVTVRLGSVKRSQGTTVPVLALALHPDWDPATDAHDVAVLTLAQDAPAAAAPAPLADPAVDAGSYAVGKLARVVGWGATVEGGSSVEDLREVDVPIVSDAECDDAGSYGGDIIDPIMLCAGFAEGGKDSCQGDSGGPLYVPADGVLKLTGVVSFGDGCARPQKYGVYAELPAAALRGFVVGRTGTPPTITIGDPGTVTRGTATTLLATASEGTPAWDLDADGAFDDATGASASFTPSSAGAVPVRARTVDADGMVQVTERTVTVAAPAEPTASEGGTASDGTGPAPSSPPAAALGPAPSSAPASRAVVRVSPVIPLTASGRRALRVKGTVLGPGCAGGQVRLSTYRGSRLLGRKVATLGPECRFAASVAARGKVTLKVRFLGTATLLPVSVTKQRRVPTRT